eukprot:30069-Chlamydomonas_euryale.AAC.2
MGKRNASRSPPASLAPQTSPISWLTALLDRPRVGRRLVVHQQQLDAVEVAKECSQVQRRVEEAVRFGRVGARL